MLSGTAISAAGTSRHTSCRLCFITTELSPTHLHLKKRIQTDQSYIRVNILYKHNTFQSYQGQCFCFFFLFLRARNWIFELQWKQSVVNFFVSFNQCSSPSLWLRLSAVSVELSFLVCSLYFCLWIFRKTYRGAPFDAGGNLAFTHSRPPDSVKCCTSGCDWMCTIVLDHRRKRQLFVNCKAFVWQHNVCFGVRE